MRRTLILPVLLVLAACSSSPRVNYYNAEKTYAGVVDSLTLLRKAGKIDDDSYRRINPSVQAANRALVSWHAAIMATPDGQKPEVARTITDAVLDALEELAIWYAKYAGGK